jgi:pimeloyl-ACP methyl ester carboxylesterase
MVLDRHGVRLATLDFGGQGQAAAAARSGRLRGRVGHDHAVAHRALRCRTVALDARGHGRSERRPADVSRAAHVGDGAFAIESLGLGPAIVIGQSLGGRTALLLAAERPDLVRALVLADAGPGGPEDQGAVEANVEDLMRSLGGWPAPFSTREAAVDFFGGPSASAEAWAGALEHRDGGWWPRFDSEVMGRTLREATRRSYWEEWERISCPVLVVRAGRGQLSAADARTMAERGQRVEVAELPDAGHDLHLGSPDEWRAAVSRFLDALDAR